MNSGYNTDLENVIENLNRELHESKDLIMALKCENDELKTHVGRIKQESNLEMATALQKNEEYKKEIKKWEEMYKEWMNMMENRVANINRTHQILQQVITQPEDETQPSSSKQNQNVNTSPKK